MINDTISVSPSCEIYRQNEAPALWTHNGKCVPTLSQFNLTFHNYKIVNRSRLFAHHYQNVHLTHSLTPFRSNLGSNDNFSNSFLLVLFVFLQSFYRISIITGKIQTNLCFIRTNKTSDAQRIVTHQKLDYHRKWKFRTHSQLANSFMSHTYTHKLS